MRLFVGAALDDTTRRSVGAAIRVYRQQAGGAGASIKWVKLANVHLTLAFLGEIASQPADEIVAALREPWCQPAFSATLSGAGVFPSTGTPSVLWIGVSEGVTPLRALLEEVEARLAARVVRPMRRSYQPHLTIGRVRHATPVVGARIRDALRTAEVPPMPWDVDRVVLYQSRLSARGASYHVLADFTLGHTEGR